MTEYEDRVRETGEEYASAMCVHDWRLGNVTTAVGTAYNSSEATWTIWYCGRCRKTEPYFKDDR